MNARGSGIKIFTGNANVEFCREVARNLNLPVGQAMVGRYVDGEICVDIQESVRGNDVFIVQPTSPPVNDHLMELLIMIDAMRRASAGRVIAVMPYFGYARQNVKAKPRQPIAARMVADLIASAGADRVLTMDLCAAQIQGFFSIPVDHLRAVSVLCNHYLNNRMEGDGLVVVSPNLSGVERARDMAMRLNAPLAVIERRSHPNHATQNNLIGDVVGKRALIVDDLINSGGTVTSAARALMEYGAAEVFACCTHGIFSGEALERITDSPITELVSTNTLPCTPVRKLRTVSVAERFSRAIECIYEDWPISPLYE